MSPGALETLLLKRITDQGPMPFAAYMQFALYHPRLGYYAQKQARTGWDGDFLTSPELDPAFGELWSRGFEQIWEACDRPDRFEVVEIGPGEGSFAAAVLGAVGGDFAAALRYRLVERNPDLEARQRERLEQANLTWSSSVLDVPRMEAGVIFANEVLDNLPVHLVQKIDDQLLEVCVSETGGSRLSWVLLPPSSPELERFLQRTGTELPEGHRIEIALAAESFVTRTAGLVARGALIAVDYGDEGPALAQRPAGSLVCYSPAGVDDDPLATPGSKDITSHVNWTALRGAGERAGLAMEGPEPQRGILIGLGAKELDASLKELQQHSLDEKAGAPVVASLSRRQALRSLLDPGGLGGLGVMVGLADIEPPAFLKKKGPVLEDGSFTN